MVFSKINVDIYNQNYSSRIVEEYAFAYKSGPYS